MRPRLLVLFALLTFASKDANAGVFLGTVRCAPDGLTACTTTHPASNGSVIVNPYGIIHPVTFQDSGGLLLPNVKVCVDEAFSGNLSRAVEWAVAKWNALEPAVNNCVNCFPGSGTNALPVNLPSTLLHELGHCGFGLNHQGLMIQDDADPERDVTFYTISYGGAAAFIDDGTDNVRGSRDDLQPAAGGSIAEVVYWFHVLDNDPINFHVGIIDGTTYSRAFADFPFGTSYPANANPAVASLLGQPQSQAVLWPRPADAVFFDLGVDDVNMVRMARTGLDRILQDPPPPAPGDDYAIQLEIVSCSDPHDLLVHAVPLGAGNLNGNCNATIDFSDPSPPSPAIANSYKVGIPTIEINSQQSFEFRIPVFYGSFETGDYDSGWVVSP